MAANLYTVFNQIENLKNVGVLAAIFGPACVGHSQPSGRRFHQPGGGCLSIDLIIDTGDLTDWGTPLEAEIITRIEELAIPYLFAAGNHEVPDVLARLGQTSNVTLLGSEPVTVSGITVAGMLDPSAGSFSPESVSVAEISRLASEINGCTGRGRMVSISLLSTTIGLQPRSNLGFFRDRVRAQSRPVHKSDRRHSLCQRRNHRCRRDQRHPGRAGDPFSLSVLYFVREPETNRYVLAAVDSIQVQSLKQSFTLQRTFVTSERRNQEENVEESTENQASME